MPNVKIGLIGVGNMGKNHLRVLNILKDADIKFIYDPDETKLESLRNQYELNFTNQLEENLDGLDAIVIASPTKYHFDYIKLCAGKVKNIFVEKPMTATIEEANEVKKLQAQYGFNLMVGFIERYNSAIMEIKNLLDTFNSISIDFTRTNKLSARITDVDVVSDLMIHDIDLALHLNGKIKTIQAQGFAQNGMISFASANFMHESGSLARLQASRLTEKKQRSVEVTCHDLYIDCDLLRKEIILNRQSHVIDSPDRPYTVQSIQENVSIKMEEALLLEIQAFLKMAQGIYHPHIPGFEAGYESVRVCDEIQRQILINE
jgi:predicted dehydrogenase